MITLSLHEIRGLHKLLIEVSLDVEHISLGRVAERPHEVEAVTTHPQGEYRVWRIDRETGAVREKAKRGVAR